MATTTTPASHLRSARLLSRCPRARAIRRMNCLPTRSADINRPYAFYELSPGEYCFDRSRSRRSPGVSDRVPPDLSTNPDHMEGFGIDQQKKKKKKTPPQTKEKTRKKKPEPALLDGGGRWRRCFNLIAV